MRNSKFPAALAAALAAPGLALAQTTPAPVVDSVKATVEQGFADAAVIATAVVVGTFAIWLIKILIKGK